VLGFNTNPTQITETQTLPKCSVWFAAFYRETIGVMQSRNPRPENGNEQHDYNLQGTGAYLNTIMGLVVLGLVLPNFTTSLSGPRFTRVQEIFLITVSVILYAIFLVIQTGRHRQYFKDAGAASDSSDDHPSLQPRSTVFHAAMLFLYLVVVIILAEKFAIPLDNCIERFGVPQAFGGAIVAGLVLAPEALAAIKAARQNHS